MFVARVEVCNNFLHITNRVLICVNTLNRPLRTDINCWALTLAIVGVSDVADREATRAKPNLNCWALILVIVRLSAVEERVATQAKHIINCRAGNSKSACSAGTCGAPCKTLNTKKLHLF